MSEVEMSAGMLLLVVVLSQVILFAARDAVQSSLAAVSRSIHGTFRLIARWFTSAASEMQERNTELLLEVGRMQIEHKIERELRRLDSGLTADLTRYTAVGRDLTELSSKMQADYQECGNLQPDAGSWGGAAKAAENLVELEDKGARKMLGELHRAASKAEKAALSEYRSGTTQRHKILSKMVPSWKRVSGLVADGNKAITKILESTKLIESHMDQFEKIRDKSEVTAHILRRSARNHFFVSSLVMVVALAGAFINFQLIALPMSELVPAGTRVSGIAVSTVAALVLVLMEITVGFFVMDMLGITNLFPRLEALPTGTRRTILAVALLALLFLASIEASLAVLREQIVGAETALRQSLAGAAPSTADGSAVSNIPLVGQAVLGFILPWILALVAIPLETFVETMGTAAVSVVAPMLQILGTLSRLLGYLMSSIVRVFQGVYDVYLAVPLQLQRLFQRGLPQLRGREGGRASVKAGSGREAEAHG
ncbi:MAG: hypothetical protein V3R77_09530 [Candidatus Binatia bacterium]